jgi:serine protease
MGWRWRLVTTALAAALLLAACTVSTGPGNGGTATATMSITLQVPSGIPGALGQCDGSINIFVYNTSLAKVAEGLGLTVSGGTLTATVSLPAGNYWIFAKDVAEVSDPGQGDCQGVSGGLYMDQWGTVSHALSGSSHTVFVAQLATRSGSLTLPSTMPEFPISTQGATPLDRSHSLAEGEAVPGEVIAKFRADGAPGTTRDRFAPQSLAAPPATLSTRAGLQSTLVRGLATGAALYRQSGGPSASPLQLAQAFAALPGVEYAEPNYFYQRLVEPDDPLYPDQWHYPAMNLPAAWDTTVGGSAAGAPATRPRIAILDTGHLAHLDLPPPLAQCDFVDQDTDATDPGPGGSTGWHGTHVAGTVGALTDNTAGVAGVIWNAQLIHGRVLGPDGGTAADIADAILWAAGYANPVLGCTDLANPDDQATVINMSLGGSGYSRTMQEAIAQATAFGALVVVAAGNSDVDAAGFTPANLDNVVTVAALNPANARASYSNYGMLIDLAAPGGEQAFGGDPNGVLSTLNANGYAYYQGTSMAAPHVAGVAGLAQYMGGGLDSYAWIPPWEMRRLLTTSSSLAGVSCPAPKTCGAGLLRADQAVAAASTWPVTVTSSDLLRSFSTGDAVTSRQFTVTNLSGSSITYTVAASSGLSVSPSGSRTLGLGLSETYTVDEPSVAENGTYFGRINVSNASFLMQVTVYYTRIGGAAKDFRSSYVYAFEAENYPPTLRLTGIFEEPSIPVGAFLPGGSRAWSIPAAGTAGIIPTNDPLLLAGAFDGTGYSGFQMAGGGYLASSIAPGTNLGGIVIPLEFPVYTPPLRAANEVVQRVDLATLRKVLELLAELASATPTPGTQQVTPRVSTQK